MSEMAYLRYIIEVIDRETFCTLGQAVNHRLADFYGPARPCRRPTKLMPGTPEKVSVLQSRASRRQDLHHPADLQWCEEESFRLAHIVTMLNSHGFVKHVGVMSE